MVKLLIVHGARHAELEPIIESDGCGGTELVDSSASGNEGFQPSLSRLAEGTEAFGARSLEAQYPLPKEPA
jgi:hypothetical protein